MMSFKTLSISELTPERRAAIQERIHRFISSWHTQFAQTVDYYAWLPQGDGDINDICCLDYAIYEGMWQRYADSTADICFISACILGRVLEKRLQMRWGEIELSDGVRLALISDYNSVIVPIQEMICHRYTSDPQFGSFEYAFFDIYLSSQSWPTGSHPLIDCNLSLEDGEFERVYGYEVPDDIRREVMLLGLQDKDWWIREVGLDAYEHADCQDWDSLRKLLRGINANFSESFGGDWRQRTERQNWHIFENWPE